MEKNLYSSPGANLEKEVELRILPVTWRRATRVWWSYLWRNLIAIVATAVLAGIAGAIIGGILGAFGASPKTIQIVGTPVGMIIGLAISIIPMKMILGKNFGEYSLVLIKNDS